VITLITGLPGRGKTLYAVQMIREAVTAGRKVYSDIEGLKIPGVEGIPQDWRETPPGSLVVYDEAHRRFPASGRAGPSPDDQVNRLDTHRHTSHDFAFVTQYPGKLHKVIRDLVDRHVHLVRAYGLQGSLIHEWGFCQASPESPTAKREADKVRWKFPRSLYSCYQSASGHGRYNSFSLPGRAIWLPVLGVALVLLLWRISASFSDRVGGPTEEPTLDADPVSLVARGFAARRDATDGRQGTDNRGCILVGERCNCFNDSGRVDIALFQCASMAADVWAAKAEIVSFPAPAPWPLPTAARQTTGSGPGMM